MQRQTGSLNILSYNIRHGRNMDDRVELDAIAGVIRDSGADIVGLQEVDRHWSERSGFADQAAWLAGTLGMDFRYGGSIDKEPTEQSGHRRRKHGVAVLSRYPIVASRQTLFRTYVGNRRELLETEIRIAEGGPSLSFYCTHWGLDAAERLAQANETLERMRMAAGPVVVTGDFNAEPHSPEIALMRLAYRDAFRPDDRAFVGPSLKGAEPEGILTFPADMPAKRIDYIFGNDRIEFANSRVIGTKASDHFPIVSEVRIVRPPTDGESG